MKGESYLAWKLFFAVGQNSAPGTLGRARVVRGAGPEGGDFGLCRGRCTLVDRSVRALAAGHRAVRACRASLPFVTCTLFRQKASRFLRRPRRRLTCEPRLLLRAQPLRLGQHLRLRVVRLRRLRGLQLDELLH